jgi:hypothetical protein
MLAAGIHAVRCHDVTGYVEVVVYDLQVIRVERLLALDEALEGEQAAPFCEARLNTSRSRTAPRVVRAQPRWSGR